MLSRFFPLVSMFFPHVTKNDFSTKCTTSQLIITPISKIFKSLTNVYHCCTIIHMGKMTVQDANKVRGEAFVLYREEDVSGISGTGIVAEGFRFTDGTTVIHWIADEHHSTVVWPQFESVEAIHGHNGATRIVWGRTEFYGE